MIEFDRLIMYKYRDEYKFAIISKDKTKVALVVENVVLNFDKTKVFTYKFMAGNIEDEWESSSQKFKDFLHGALADDDRRDVIYPDPKILPDYRKFAKLEERFPCCGLTAEREELAKIEKFLNKKVFKEIIKQEQKDQEKKAKKPYIEYNEF